MKNLDIVIAAARRTPIGAFQGGLAPVAVPQLGATVISSALGEAGLDAADISEVIMGCVLPAGVGQAHGRRPSEPEFRTRWAARLSTKCAGQV